MRRQRADTRGNMKAGLVGREARHPRVQTQDALAALDLGPRARRAFSRGKANARGAGEAGARRGADRRLAVGGAGGLRAPPPCGVLS